MLKKTFEDFVDLAFFTFGKHEKLVTTEDEQRERERIRTLLLSHMRNRGVTKRQVVCYINWVNGMTQGQIADELGVEQPAISQFLNGLKDKWPHLFQFPEVVMHQYDPLRDDHQTLRQF